MYVYVFVRFLLNNESDWRRAAAHCFLAADSGYLRHRSCQYYCQRQNHQLGSASAIVSAISNYHFRKLVGNSEPLCHNILRNAEACSFLCRTLELTQLFSVFPFGNRKAKPLSILLAFKHLLLRLIKIISTIKCLQ